MRNIARASRLSLALVALAAVLGLAGPGLAASAPPGVAAAFGATLKATYPDGRFQSYWFKSDGTWRAIGRRGLTSSGKWTAKGDRVCLKQTKPIPSPVKYCTDFPPKLAIGASWPGKDIGGKPIELSLIKGDR